MTCLNPTSTNKANAVSVAGRTWSDQDKGFNLLCITMAGMFYSLLASINIVVLLFKGNRAEYMTIAIVGIILLLFAVAKTNSARSALQELKGANLDEGVYSREFKPDTLTSPSRFHKDGITIK